MEKVETHLDQLDAALQPVKQKLIDHPLYHKIQDLDALRLFTEYHVYAVWDFMSLLKSLQLALTCTSLPWHPVGDPTTRYLINEIVTGEESDVDEHGNRCSHFELYLDAMHEMGSQTNTISNFVQTAIESDNILETISNSNLPQFVKDFLHFTFDVVLNAPLHIKAAVFTFGREDLIPDMFISIVRELSSANPEKLSIFKYYLERHIEVDGDEHSILGKQMVERLCGDDEQKWEDAIQMSIQSLEMRNHLWNGIAELIG